MLARDTKFAYTIGYNYTDLYAQTFICFRDQVNSAMTGPGGVAGYLIYTPTNSPCPAAIFSEEDDSINLGTTAFYKNKQHYFYSDLMWKPVRRITATLGYSGSFANGDTVFLDPLQPAGTLAFTYQKPFTAIQIDLYRGLSFKTTWNYYMYRANGSFSPSIPVTVTGIGATTYGLQPIGTPDYNGSTLMLAFRYAF
jgi:hypothetical protein